jgi:branched-subunit amino acid ABC-type transport system permease component
MGLSGTAAEDLVVGALKTTGKDIGDVAIEQGAKTFAEHQAEQALKAAAEQAAKTAAEDAFKKNVFTALKVTAGAGAAALGGYAVFKPKELGSKLGSVIGDLGGGIAGGVGKAVGTGVGSASGGLVTSLAESFGITAKQFKMYITIAVIIVLAGFTAKLVL